MLNNEQLDLVRNKKFSEFSDVVKAELHSKLYSHEDITNFNSETNKIQELKAKFQEINSLSTADE